jgi:predicted dienelactone hydrolase
MHSLRFTAETSSNGVIERDFMVGDVPGVLWSPVSGSEHAPVVLMGHGGGLHKKTPALVARAHATVTTWGFAVVAIDAPGHGDRPRTAADELARAEFRQAQAARDTERFESISVRYVTTLAQRAVPEWQATLDALQKLPEIGTEAPIGYGAAYRWAPRSGCR